jgi:hypothetical protein
MQHSCNGLVYKCRDVGDRGQGKHVFPPLFPLFLANNLETAEIWTRKQKMCSNSLDTRLKIHIWSQMIFLRKNFLLIFFLPVSFDQSNIKYNNKKELQNEC